MQKSLLLAALALSLTASADTYPRKILLEQFTGIACVNCPYGNEVLNNVTKGRSDVAWVTHHAGYQPDELTVQASQELADAFGVTTAPTCMISRTPFSQTEDGAPKLVLATGYTNPAVGVEIFSPFFNEVAATEANVGISVNPVYDIESNRLTVTVDLERNEFLPQDALLTVVMAENGVYATTIQAGTVNTHRHNHTMRHAFTSILGDEITWSDNKATETFSVELEPSWLPNRLYIVAYVNRPVVRGINNNEVLNAEQTGYFTDFSGISAIETDGADAPVRYFDLQGRPVANPSDGVFIRLQGTEATKVRL